MINFMVLSSDAPKIKDYFRVNSGGDIDIRFCYESLHASYSQIINSNIKVDKFIIVFSQDSNMNIKQEMATLRDIMETNSFFRVGEIIVYAEENDYCTTALDHFKFVMECFDFTGYSIKTTKDKITMQYLYTDTLSIDPGRQKTSFNRVYRVKKGEDSKVGYEPIKGNFVYQVKSENGYENYEKVKHNAIKSESGRVISEPAQKQIGSFDFELDSYESNFNSIKNIVIFTGTHKSGTSIFCSTMFLTKKNNLMVDVSKNQGSIQNLKLLSNSVEEIDLKDLLVGSIYNSDSSKCIANPNGKTSVDLLKYIISIPNRITYDTLVIDVDLDDLESIIKVLHVRVKTIVFTSDVSLNEISNLYSLFERYKCYNQYLFLNKCSRYDIPHQINPVDLINQFSWLKIIQGENLFESSLDLGDEFL